MLHFRRAITWPWQPEVVTIQLVTGELVDAAFGFERIHVKRMHIAHVGLQALGALAGVSDGPNGAVHFAQNFIGHRFVHAFHFLQLVVFDQLLAKTQLLRQLVHDHVVGTRFVQRIHDFFTPLQRAV